MDESRRLKTSHQCREMVNYLKTTAVLFDYTTPSPHLSTSFYTLSQFSTRVSTSTPRTIDSLNFFAAGRTLTQIVGVEGVLISFKISHSKAQRSSHSFCKPQIFFVLAQIFRSRYPSTGSSSICKWTLSFPALYSFMSIQVVSMRVIAIEW